MKCPDCGEEYSKKYNQRFHEKTCHDTLSKQFERMEPMTNPTDKSYESERAEAGIQAVKEIMESELRHDLNTNTIVAFGYKMADWAKARFEKVIAEKDKSIKFLEAQLTYAHKDIYQINKQLASKDQMIEKFYEVLNHAVQMGQYTPGGSTEGWAKRVIAEYEAWEKTR